MNIFSPLLNRVKWTTTDGTENQGRWELHTELQLQRWSWWFLPVVGRIPGKASTSWCSCFWKRKRKAGEDLQPSLTKMTSNFLCMWRIPSSMMQPPSCVQQVISRYSNSKLTFGKGTILNVRPGMFKRWFVSKHKPSLLEILWKITELLTELLASLGTWCHQSFWRDANEGNLIWRLFRAVSSIPLSPWTCYAGFGCYWRCVSDKWNLN